VFGAGYGAGVSIAEAADDDFCYVTTRGRISGEPHEIEIWFARHGSTLFLPVAIDLQS
jgi:hypothetical protein